MADDNTGENIIKRDNEIDQGDVQPEHHPFAGANEFVQREKGGNDYFKHDTNHTHMPSHYHNPN